MLCGMLDFRDFVCVCVYHGVQQMNASQQLWSSLTVQAKQQPSYGLLFTQAGVIPVYNTHTHTQCVSKLQEKR